jgi:hypothetical protein
MASKGNRVGGKTQSSGKGSTKSPVAGGNLLKIGRSVTNRGGYVTKITGLTKSGNYKVTIGRKGGITRNSILTKAEFLSRGK